VREWEKKGKEGHHYDKTDIF